MLWLFLLAAVTLLVISRRRLRLRIMPLDDELYTSKVAVEYVHTGVGFVSQDGILKSVNQALTETLAAKPGELLDHDWYLMFPRTERAKVSASYAQMLLAGIASVDTLVERGDGELRPVNLRLVAVHDHRSRLVGHHCIINDESRTRALEQQIQDLSQALADAGYELVPSDERQEWASAQSRAS